MNIGASEEPANQTKLGQAAFAYAQVAAASADSSLGVVHQQRNVAAQAAQPGRLNPPEHLSGFGENHTLE